jgi:hypothetical protein
VFAEQFTFHIVFWRWVAVETALAIGDELSANLNSLTLSEWHRVLSAIALTSDIFRGESEQVPLPAKIASARMALLLALRDVRYRQSAFFSFIKEMKATHILISEFKASEALQAAKSGLLDWDPALDVIRGDYSELGVVRVHEWYGDHQILPEAVVQRILSEPEAFPVALWDAAVTNATAAARKAVRPVGLVARKDRWFASDRPRNGRTRSAPRI